jgi:hypothetical protein
VAAIHQRLERKREGHFQPIREAPRPAPLVVPVKRGPGRPRKVDQR